MGLSRRGFLKVTAAGGLGISALGFDLKPAYAASRQLKIRNARRRRASEREQTNGRDRQNLFHLTVSISR